MAEAEPRWVSGATGPSEIRDAIHRLWRDLPGTDVRQSVQNLVAYSTDSAWCEAAEGTLRELAGQHPSRKIILLPGGDSLGAEVRLIVEPLRGGEGRCVFGEEIRLHVPAGRMYHPASLVWPLLLPDLPTVLFWGGDLARADSAWRELEPMADALVIDSATFFDPLGSLGRLGRLERSGRIRLLGDLNLRRLSPWQRAVTALFDLPEAADSRFGLREVEVDTPGGIGGALLMGLWIAGKLGEPPEGFERDADGCRARSARGLGYLFSGAGRRRILFRMPRGPSGTVLEVVERDGGFFGALTLPGRRRREMALPVEVSPGPLGLEYPAPRPSPLEELLEEFRHAAGA